MSKTLRVRRNGTRVYEIRVSRGRDPITGKQLTPYSMTWTIPENYSDKKAEREASKIEGEFIAKCKAGEVLTKQEEMQRRKVEAEQEERSKLEQASKPTYAEYVKLYLKRFEAGHAPGTVVSYRQALERAEKTFGKYKLEDITKGMMRQYITDLQDTSGMKYNTYNRHYTILRLMFESAVEDGTLVESPMRDLKRPRKSKDEKLSDGIDDKAYDETEVTYILNCINKEPLRWRALITFMLDTGCRRGEVAGLKWNNVDLSTGEVTICNNLQYTKEKGVYETSPKSGKSRTIFLTKPALAIMKEWKYEQTVIRFRNAIPISGYCFEGKDGQGMNPSCISAYFNKLGKVYNIPHFHPHALRHTMATISIANGADIVSVSKKLGHANTSITLNVYSHANEEAQRRANEILENAIYGNTTKQA